MNEFGVKTNDCDIGYNVGVEEVHQALSEHIRALTSVYSVEFNMDPTGDKSKVCKLGLFAGICDKLIFDLSEDITEDSITKYINNLAKAIILTTSEFITINITEYIEVVTNMLRYKLNIYRQTLPIISETLLGKSFLAKDDLDLIRNNSVDFRKCM